MIKHYLPKNSTIFCVEILGIGADIKAERELQQLFPKCSFLGVDPVYEAGKIYEQLGGPFVHAAIWKEDNGTLEASVFKNEWYVTRNVTTIRFETVLDMVRGKVIDFLFMDAEGAEYAVLPHLTRFLSFLHSFFLFYLSFFLFYLFTISI